MIESALHFVLACACVRFASLRFASLRFSLLASRFGWDSQLERQKQFFIFFKSVSNHEQKILLRVLPPRVLPPRVLPPRVLPPRVPDRQGACLMTSPSGFVAGGLLVVL